MRLFYIFSILVSAVLFSCKRERFDPENYKDLIYHYVEIPAPPKEYIFQATVDGKQWSAVGNAVISSDTMIIKASYGSETVLIRISDYLNQPAFEIGHLQDSAALFVNGEPVFEYASIESSSGKLTLVKPIDKIYNQIEATFNLTLVSESGEELKITNGYIKINFSPNDIYWVENNGDIRTADAVSANAVDPNFYEVLGQDTNTRRTVKLLIPKKPSRGYDPTVEYTWGTEGFQIYYSLLSNGTYLTASGGKIKVLSNKDNIIKGTFSQVFKNGTRNIGINGSFSARY